MTSLPLSGRKKEFSERVLSMVSTALRAFWSLFSIASFSILLGASQLAYGQNSSVSNLCELAIVQAKKDSSSSLTDALRIASRALIQASRDNRSQAHAKLSLVTRELDRLRVAEAPTAENLRQRIRMTEVQSQILERMRPKLELIEGEKVTELRFRRKLFDEAHEIQWYLDVSFANGFKYELGKLVYAARGHHFEIIEFDIEINEKFARTGVSIVLAAKALEDNPQTLRIDSALIVDNKAAYMNAIYHHRMHPVDAVKETPAYKMRRYLGYELDPGESTLPNHPNEKSIIRMNTYRLDVREEDTVAK